MESFERYLSKVELLSFSFVFSFLFVIFFFTSLNLSSLVAVKIVKNENFLQKSRKIYHYGVISRESISVKQLLMVTKISLNQRKNRVSQEK